MRGMTARDGLVIVQARAIARRDEGFMTADGTHVGRGCDSADLLVATSGSH